MSNHKNIHNIFESWGKNKQEIPPHNDVLKREILSKIPVSLVKSPYSKQIRLPWLSFAFTTMAMVVLLVSYNQNNIVGISNVTTGSTETSISVPSVDSKSVNVPTPNVQNVERQVSGSGGYANSSAGISDGLIVTPPASDVYYPMPQPSSPISDNREFLKINYNATLRVRNVSEIKSRIETIVRGFSGRVDTSNSAEKWGYINFAIPKSEFESFKTEIKSLVGSKLYIEQTNSQNLLSQKQNIEQNQKQVTSNLSALNSERQQIVRNHNQNISLYQTRIDSINSEITTLGIEYKSANPVRQAEIANRINQLQIEIGNIEKEIINENNDYQYRISQKDAQIKNSQEISKSLKVQDGNLIDDVATVNGTISLNWISLWEIADIYTPGPLLMWILLACAVVAYLWFRRAGEEWEV